MYSAVLPRTGFVLSGAGMASTAYHLTWLTIACFVIAGALITFSKFFPRVAIEPIRESRAAPATHWRWRLTVNGFTRRRRR